MCYKSEIQVAVYVYILMMVAGAPTNKLQIRRGESASLMCLFQELDETTSIRWKLTKEGILTSGTNIYRHINNIEVQKPTQHDWTLIIKKVDDAFVGDYTCETNTEKVIARWTLEIVDGPRLIQDSSSDSKETFSEGSSLELKCYFSGVPTPTIRWYRGLKNAVDTGITGEILRLPKVKRYAADSYICEGKNLAGSLKYTIDLAVNFPVEVDVMEEIINAKEGEVVSLVCVVEGHPIKEGYWMDPNGKKIIPGWKFNVTTEKDGDSPVEFITAMSRTGMLLLEDFGKYICVGEGDSNTASKMDSTGASRLVVGEDESNTAIKVTRLVRCQRVV